MIENEEKMTYTETQEREDGNYYPTDDEWNEFEESEETE
jgi:hypothetical protein